MKLKFIDGSTKGIEEYMKNINPLIEGALLAEQKYNVDDLERFKENKHEQETRKESCGEIP